jgi:hypothetical protein
MKKIVLAAAAAVIIALTAAPSFAAPQSQSAFMTSYQELPGNWGSGRHVEPGVGR